MPDTSLPKLMRKALAGVTIRTRNEMPVLVFILNDFNIIEADLMIGDIERNDYPHVPDKRPSSGYIWINNKGYLEKIRPVRLNRPEFIMNSVNSG